MPKIIKTNQAYGGEGKRHSGHDKKCEDIKLHKGEKKLRRLHYKS